MYKIVVSDQCSCFKKSTFENNLTFENKDEALIKAIDMKDKMNFEFCKKHRFDVEEMFNNFIISFKKRDRREDCCGNGCCF